MDANDINNITTRTMSCVSATKIHVHTWSYALLQCALCGSDTSSSMKACNKLLLEKNILRCLQSYNFCRCLQKAVGKNKCGHLYSMMTSGSSSHASSVATCSSSIRVAYLKPHTPIQPHHFTLFVYTRSTLIIFTLKTVGKREWHEGTNIKIN